MLADLFAHQAWADALHWTAALATPAALADPAFRTRQHHIHTVQRAFLCMASGEPFQYAPLADDAVLAEMLPSVRRFHDEAAAFVANATPRLAEPITLPWFQDPPCTVPLEQALHQVVMHSHYHRGQNATRLRELGGDPPMVDLIVWYWKQRPAPEWP